MAIVFISDVQARNHQPRSKILPNGRNSRLQNALDALKQAGDLAQNGTLVVNGDLFDDRFSLDIDVMDAVTEAIFEAAEKASVVLNVGNHDQFTRDGRIHSLRGMAAHPNVTVVPSEGCTVVGQARLYLYPFTEKNELVIEYAAKAAQDARRFESPAFLVLHQPVESALLGNGEADTTGLPVGALHSNAFVAVILGHYHKPQQVADANIFYVGSPYQVNSGERGDEKRFLVWDGTLKSVPVVGMPRFIRVSSMEEALKYPHDFVDLVCAPDDTQKMPQNVLYVPEIKEMDQTPSTLVNFDIEEAIQVWFERKNASSLVEKALKYLSK